MSEAAVFNSIYDQLRWYADQLDRALVSLRSSDSVRAKNAQKELADLLHEISNKDTVKPATRLVALILRQELPSISDKGLDICEALAKVLEKRLPDFRELQQLEQIAIALDRECSNTSNRMKGRS